MQSNVWNINYNMSCLGQNGNEPKESILIGDSTHWEEPIKRGKNTLGPECEILVVTKQFTNSYNAEFMNERQDILYLISPSRLFSLKKK